MRATKAIIHLGNFSRNVAAVQERIGPGRCICAPIKADAYGHGSLPIARAAIDAGVSCLGVAAVDEAIELRKGGIDAPILLFSQPLPGEIPLIIQHRLSPLVSDAEFAGFLARAAAASGVRLPVHLKIDTGMGRIGCAPADAAALAQTIAHCAWLEYAGTATHLAFADSPAEAAVDYTRRQVDCLHAALDEIRAAGLDPGVVHAANSGAVIRHHAAWFDMVRPGLLLYGYASLMDSDMPGPPFKVEPVMELRSVVSLIKPLRQGEQVSYGGIWVAPQDTFIGVLPVGYADGLPRRAGNHWQVYIRGKAYPLVGQICMDQCMVDLGTFGEVKRWDDVVVFGGAAPDASVLAERIDAIPYEITCGIAKRVPLVYENQGNAG
ncbi:MAG: alanine racemase [Treponema sp.]|jgi:alanine racemase|nr:alanine racemase [Treponema sp.]